jgi:hypothetical protein
MTVVITMRCRKSERVVNESNGIFTRATIDALTAVEQEKSAE